MTLIAVDWGTSALRGALLGEHGEVLEQCASAQGILNVPPGQFATVFRANFGHWLSTGTTLTLISGMAGSQQGWVEAPYCACPAGFEELGAKLQWITGEGTTPVAAPVAIVPGLSCEHNGIPDVMRGEEIQVFGALQLLGLHDATVVLPGTHSKWVTVRGQRILHFRSYMTGEVFALLRQHSLLARTLPPLGPTPTSKAEDAPPEAEDTEAFDDGVIHALRSHSLLNTAFSTRTLALFGRKSPAALVSYLSGLVIGEELRAQHPEPGSEVIVIGSAALTQRYARALALCQVKVRLIGAESTWHGLWALSKKLQTMGKPMQTLA